MKPDIKSKFSHRYLNLEKKLPLEKFIPSAFLIFLLILFILSVITYYNIERYKSDIRWISHSNEVLKKVEEINVNILEIPLVRRGYIITGETEYITEFDSLIKNIQEEILNLKKLTLKKPNQLILVNSLDSISELNLEITGTIISDTGKKILSNKWYLEKQINATNEVQKNLMYINKITQDLKMNELLLFQSGYQKAERINSTIQQIIIILCGFSFLVIGLSLFISDRLIKNKSTAEDLLLKSYEELEYRVESRTQELKESNQKLSDEISYRKKIEETLRESEHRFRIMADSAPVLIWISGHDGKFTYFNSEWLSFTGRTMEQESGHSWFDGIHPDDLEKYRNVYEESFKKRIPFEIEFRLKNSAGEYIWIYNKGTPRYEGENFVGYTGSCTDINERVKSESYLKIQYEVSKTLAESKTLEEASNKLLENICNGPDWDFGILWSADDNNEFIKIHTLWSKDKSKLKEYENNLDVKRTFPLKNGFSKNRNSEGKSLWIKDLKSNEDLYWKYDINKTEWLSGIEIPIKNGTETIAMIECLSKKSIEEKLDLIAVLESAGRQIGNFIERIKAEKKLMNSNLELEENVRKRTTELANAFSKLMKESEEKEVIQNKIKLFAHTIKSMRDSVFIADLDSNVLFVNEAFELTYGYEDKSLMGKEVPLLKNISPVLKKSIVENSMKNGWKGELLTQKYDGTDFYTYLSTSSINNEEGIAEAWVGICQDVTELKKAEELILKRNNLLLVLNEVVSYTNNIFDFNAGLQYSIDKICEYTNWEIGHCYMYVNDKFVSSKIWNTGMSEDYSAFRENSEKLTFKKGEGFPGEILLNKESGWKNLAELKKVKNFVRWEIVQDLDLKTGIWVPILKNNKVIGTLEFFKRSEDEQDEEILKCINNIGIEIGSLSEKIETIDKIRQSEKNLNDAQHIAKLGNWEWDIVNNKITWSDELYRIFDVKKSEFQPTFDGYLERLNEADVERVQYIIQNAIENKNSFSFYHRLKMSDGKEKIIKSQGEVYIDKNNNAVRMFGTAHDVTEISEAEKELRRINAKLIETQKELIYKEKLAALGRFSSGVAHEIRNPLANISSLAQMIAKADIDEKNRRRLNFIISNIEIANRIIKNLLSFASPEDLKYSLIDVKEMVRDIIDSVEARCRTNKINIKFETPENLPLMKIDKVKLEAAFMNFVSNSIEAINGSGNITIRMNPESNGKIIRFEFSDTGMGIPAENIDKILEPFFTTKDEGVGLGMGLAYQTVRLHGGTYEIQSTVGKGTSIILKIPVNKN